MDIEILSSGFRAVSDPTRLNILRLLEYGPRCVCELQQGLPEVASNLLSHHLKVLREANLVYAQRRGRWIDYSLNGETLGQLRQAIPYIKGYTPPSSCEAL